MAPLSVPAFWGLLLLPLAALALRVRLERVYSGDLGPAWSYESLGCDRVQQDTQAARAGSQTALSASLAPWGRLVLASDKPFSGDAVFDFFFKGDETTRTTLQLANSNDFTHSAPLEISLSTTENVRIISGPDRDGWLHGRFFHVVEAM